MISWQGPASQWGRISLPPWILLLRNVCSPQTWRTTFPSLVAQIRSCVLEGRLNLPFCSTGQDKALALIFGGNTIPGAHGSVWCSLPILLWCLPMCCGVQQKEPWWCSGKSRSSVPWAVLLISDFSFWILYKNVPVLAQQLNAHSEMLLPW